MSLLSWIFTLLVFFGGRELGRGGLLQSVQAQTCCQWSTPSELENGDAVVGGLFNLYYKPPDTARNFTQQPTTKLQSVHWVELQYFMQFMQIVVFFSQNPTVTVTFSSFLISGWKIFLCRTYMSWCLQWRRSITAQCCCQVWSWGSTFGIAATSIPGPHRQHYRWLEETTPAVIFQHHWTTLLRLLKKRYWLSLKFPD